MLSTNRRHHRATGGLLLGEDEQSKRARHSLRVRPSRYEVRRHEVNVVRLRVYLHCARTLLGLYVFHHRSRMGSDLSMYSIRGFGAVPLISTCRRILRLATPGACRGPRAVLVFWAGSRPDRAAGSSSKRVVELRLPRPSPRIRSD